ncbi:MAG: hypothetical protein ABSH28_22360 [Acidobacteriota bacterium]
MMVFLYVDKPVASLQFDLDTTGAVTLVDTVQKQIAQAPVNGKIRVIVYGLNQVVFQGRFATVNAPVSGVSNVVGAALDGSPVSVTVKTLSPPGKVKVEISP